jgi:hypothetical protein
LLRGESSQANKRRGEGRRSKGTRRKGKQRRGVLHEEWATLPNENKLYEKEKKGKKDMKNRKNRNWEHNVHRKKKRAPLCFAYLASLHMYLFLLTVLGILDLLSRKIKCNF